MSFMVKLGLTDSLSCFLKNVVLNDDDYPEFVVPAIECFINSINFGFIMVGGSRIGTKMMFDDIRIMGCIDTLRDLRSHSSLDVCEAAEEAIENYSRGKLETTI
eukprot:gnl/Chilomastix_caulleri/753.p1 GENE.gnl/Chilomastix_caulleri/753~~gnl/Chilomastix_caulleri/753.p1  ORF type:complete len:104 (+),score=20.20 gnl/Chilomastix_caulleri/753:278-589(+)